MWPQHWVQVLPHGNRSSLCAGCLHALQSQKSKGTLLRQQRILQNNEISLWSQEDLHIGDVRYPRLLSRVTRLRYAELIYAHLATSFFSTEARNVRYRKPLCEVSVAARSSNSAPALISFSRFSLPGKSPLNACRESSYAIESVFWKTLTVCHRSWPLSVSYHCFSFLYLVWYYIFGFLLAEKTFISWLIRTYFERNFVNQKNSLKIFWHGPFKNITIKESN